MDSPHRSIEAWWPADGPAFAIRANERLLRRLEASRQLLGANLEVPDLRGLGDALVKVEEVTALEQVDAIDWDGLRGRRADEPGTLELTRRLMVGT